VGSPASVSNISATRDLVEAIQTKLDERAAGMVSVSPKNQPYASDVDPASCLRRQVLSITHWQERAPIPADRQGRLEAGVEAEGKAIRLLKELGFTVVKEQMPFELKHRKANVPCLRGKIDAFIQWRRAEVPTEVKSLHPHVFASLGSIEDLDRWWWTRRYLYQLQAYMIGYGLPEALLVVTNLLGEWKLFPIALDYEIAERIWSYAETVLDRVAAFREAGALPDYSTNPTECARCDFFGRACQPPLLELGARWLEDPELHADLERWSELRPSHREYEALDKRVKGSIRKALPASPVARGIAGRFAITVSDHSVKAEAKPRPARVDRYVEIEPLNVETVLGGGVNGK